MIRRLNALFHRYAGTHLELASPGGTLRDAAGETVGHVDRIVIGRGQLRVSGWARAAQVTLHLAGQEAGGAPRLIRSDVGQALGISPEVGFDLSLPCTGAMLAGAQAPGLSLQPLPGAAEIPAVPLVLPRGRRQKGRLALRFGLAAALCLPAAIGWVATRQPRYRTRVKTRLGLSELILGTALEPAFLAPAPAAAAPAPPVRVTIVLPVYNAFDLLEEVLDRIERHTDLPWRLIAIEDCSSDARVRPFLARWCAERPDRVQLIENAENLGFIGSVNAGLGAAMAQKPPRDGTAEGPVVLLNSDAFVPENWASRLVAPMRGRPEVATVTPMSNDAEIFTTPRICRRMVLRPGQLAAMDAVAARLSPAAPCPETPTGVGFCMAMSRDWLARQPALDTAFGRGYGEEVDWCRKAMQKGARHLAQPRLFVEHRGGESFGSEAKLALVAANNAIISRRYPGYDQEVQDFIAADPLLTPRLALGLAWAGSLGTGRLPVYLAHSLGGGAEMYLERRIARDLDRVGAAVVLRVGGLRRWQIELVTPDGTIRGGTDDRRLVERLLAPLPARELVYSCGVGDPDPLALPDLMLALSEGPDDRVEMLFHDWFPLSPSYTLLDRDGVYRGPVTPGRADPAHRGRDAEGREVSLAEWQERWGRLAARAEELRVFSADGAEQLRAVWPEHAGAIRVRPHALLTEVPPLAAPAPGGPRRVAVLGNIGQQKGAALLAPLFERLMQEHGIELLLIGNVDPAYALPAAMTVHGDYGVSEIPDLVRRYEIGAWLIPSIWPETFSYTTHEALATGLPVLAFDLGAQGAAVTRAANGHPVPYTPGGDLVEMLLGRLARTIADRAAPETVT